MAFPLLTDSQNTADGLALDRRIPLRFEEVDAAGNGQVVESNGAGSQGHEEDSLGCLGAKGCQNLLSSFWLDLAVDPRIRYASLEQ